MRQSLSEYDDRDDDGFSLVGEPRQEEAPAVPPVDRSLTKYLLTGGAMVVFAGGLWFAYIQGTHHVSPNTTMQSDGVPLLKPDAQPTKVKPEQPGGMPMPNQNMSLYNDKPGAEPVEKLLPPPEKPMVRPAPPPIVPPAPAAAQTPVVPPASAISAEPPAAPAKAAAKPAVAAKAPAVEKPAAASSKTAAAAAKAELAPAAAAKTGPVVVRVGSVRTPEAAREEWSRLKRENADILGSVRANAVRTDLGDKGIYYRIEAGPFNDAAAAERLCGEMKRRSLGCILAR
jgi:hypothetical protein